jgi:hypothetical protein
MTITLEKPQGSDIFVLIFPEKGGGQWLIKYFGWERFLRHAKYQAILSPTRSWPAMGSGRVCPRTHTAALASGLVLAEASALKNRKMAAD